MGSMSIYRGKKNNSLALIASGRHLQSDTYSTLGIIAGLILIYFTDLLWLDSAIALVLCISDYCYRLQNHPFIDRRNYG